MQLVIIAGGQGKRLRSRLGDLPKVLAPVGGRPLLEHHIELARRYGFDDIVLLVGHRSQAISDWAGDGSKRGVRLRCIAEPAPLGSAGAVFAALPALDERFMVLYGDLMLNVDLGRFWKFHCDRRAAASLLAHPNDHPADSDLVEIAGDGRVSGWHPAPRDPGRDYRNLVSAGLYIIERQALAPFAGMRDIVDFGKDGFPRMIAGGTRLFGYLSPEYIKDAGTPERLDEVNADYATGKITGSSLDVPAPAVFLDRDGTINELDDYVTRPDQLRLFTYAAAAIRELNRSGRRVVVVTNQPVIARGDCTEEGLAAIHNRLETLLGRAGAYVDRIYHCPHHPDGGFPGERKDLKIRCCCRKPATGMIDAACADLNLDRSQSWLIGDSDTDIQAANRAGIRGILVGSGSSNGDALPDFRAANLSEAVSIVLRGWARGSSE
jgi:histidinol-phosphate phosphatase family protein